MDKTPITDPTELEKKLIYKHSIMGRLKHGAWRWRLAGRKRFFKRGLIAGLVVGIGTGFAALKIMGVL